jgi:hypothetical protein
MTLSIVTGAATGEQGVGRRQQIDSINRSSA